jgi:hypothetical protein
MRVETLLHAKILVAACGKGVVHLSGSSLLIHCPSSFHGHVTCLVRECTEFQFGQVTCICGWSYAVIKV